MNLIANIIGIKIFVAVRLVRHALSFRPQCRRHRRPKRSQSVHVPIASRLALMRVALERHVERLRSKNAASAQRSKVPLYFLGVGLGPGFPPLVTTGSGEMREIIFLVRCQSELKKRMMLTPVSG